MAMDVRADERRIKEIKKEIRHIENEIEKIGELSQSDSIIPGEEIEAGQNKARGPFIEDGLWKKIVGVLGTIIIYGLLLGVRFLIGIMLKGGLPTFEDVVTIDWQFTSIV